MNGSPASPGASFNIYEESEKVNTALHSASLMMTAMEHMINKGIETGGPSRSRDLFEVIDQLAKVISTFIKEAISVSDKITFNVSGAHQ